jgi:hypothetical protein
MIASTYRSGKHMTDVEWVVVADEAVEPGDPVVRDRATALFPLVVQ